MLLDRMLRWFTRTRFFIWLCRVPIANLNFRLWGYPTLPIAESYFAILDALSKEDPEANSLYAFVSCDSRSMSGSLVRWLTRSDWSHAGVVLQKRNEDLRLLHMMGDGLMDWHILKLMRELDNFAILRFDLADKQAKETVFGRLEAFRQQRPDYDFQQEIESRNRFSCSEMVYRLLEGIPYWKDGKLITLTPHEAFGRLVFEPDAVYKAASYVVWQHVG